jgi:hypothetical protein
MSRHPEVEAILQARYDLQNCEPEAKAECLRKYHGLLDQAIEKAVLKGVTRQDLERLLGDAYNVFRKAREREDRAKLSRLR